MKSITTAVLAAIMLVLTLGGCATKEGAAPVDQAQRVLQIARTGYTAAAIAVGVYDKLAPCGPAGAARICRDAAVADQLDKAMVTAKTALDAAGQVLAAAGSDAETREKVIVIAQAAVTALLQALSTYGLAG
ncbi:hypothetical protein [Reyranella sp.]|uniref:hypothetical protein n=1 Tax=Reyranella sp. TaxID=1929291 RepID=UPI002731D267|nr:hypothetical protein [Reyranella sp.]MDP2377802.1 hypothetical protein [Reyranella sp.]